MSNQPTSLPEDDVDFVMDEFQRNFGKIRPLINIQIIGEAPQSAESANSTEDPDFGEFF